MKGRDGHLSQYGHTYIQHSKREVLGKRRWRQRQRQDEGSVQRHGLVQCGAAENVAIRHQVDSYGSQYLNSEGHRKQFSFYTNSGAVAAITNVSNIMQWGLEGKTFPALTDSLVEDPKLR